MGGRVLVAGMGNLLRGDDGFGIVVARRLTARPDLPREVRVLEVGTAGISLVQELLDGYESLVIIDAVRRGADPGTLMVLTPQVPDLQRAGWDEAGALLGDPHTTTPSRVLLLARALGALPARTRIVGCEPQDCDELVMHLSARVAAAVEPAVERVLALARAWQAVPAAGST